MARKNEENPHERHCLDNADHFTTARGRGATRERGGPFPTLAAAQTHAEGYGDGRTMIYAVTKAGLSAHICNA